MVDHFGLWDEPALKKKFKFQQKEQLDNVAKAKKKEVTKIYTDALQARREEILVFIETLKNLDKKQERVSKILLSKQAKKRQQELIYTKKILEQEMQPKHFILAS